MVPQAYGQLTAEQAAQLGLEPRFWGLVLCQDDAGRLVTLATEDLAWRDTLAGRDGAELAAVELPADRFRPAPSRPAWGLDLTRPRA